MPARVETRRGLLKKSRLLTLPTNIRLGWKLMAVANTLAYCELAQLGCHETQLSETRHNGFKHSGSHRNDVNNNNK
jgi:hypothetical protein